MKHLTLEMIGRSSEIQDWLKQFEETDRMIATELLMRLSFCTRDTYAKWLIGQLDALGKRPCALYAVRRLPSHQINLWDKKSRIVHRPATARGSEDLVMSIVAQLARHDEDRMLNHPSISTIYKRQVRDIAFLDDSVGSGDRVASFAQLFFRHPSILSLWSYGKIHLHVFALARSDEGERRILDCLPGRDSPTRVYPKSSKVHFNGPYAYSTTQSHHRWGPKAEDIFALCRRTKQIPRDRRLGYDSVMSNLVFYHSVPNNIPGMLYVSNARWRGLFPDRCFPNWLASLLDGPSPSRSRLKPEVSTMLLAAMTLIKKGLSRSEAIGRRLGVSSTYLSQVFASGVASGFLTEENRLTKAGSDALFRNIRGRREAKPFDRSLYVPQFWCAGQDAVQPLPSSLREVDRTTFRRPTKEASE